LGNDLFPENISKNFELSRHCVRVIGIIGKIGKVGRTERGRTADLHHVKIGCAKTYLTEKPKKNRSTTDLNDQGEIPNARILP
jgi:hypothetical protein